MADIEIAVEVLAFTDKALRVTDGNVTEWVPRSVIKDYTGEEDNPETIFLSEYWAEIKGFI